MRITGLPGFGLMFFLYFIVGSAFISCSSGSREDDSLAPLEIELPQPRRTGEMSLEEAIFNRKSVRIYKDEPLSLDEVSQILWAAGGRTVDGVTGATRSYPSAGGIYPLEIYLVAGKVKGVVPGIYIYNWGSNKIRQLKSGDYRQDLTKAALGQGVISAAPASIVFAGNVEKTAARYRERGRTRYIAMDVGGAGQNVSLQAESLGLGTVIVGAFDPDKVSILLGIEDEEPLYIMPIGKR